MFSAVSIAAAFLLLAADGYRVVTAIDVTRWWVPLAVIAGLTNPIHQWAHMPRPPRVIRALQAVRLLLGRDEHHRHHWRPYDCRYCITTGWCNRPLEAIGFYRRMEQLITRLTGAAPRHDDRRYEERLADRHD